MIYAGGAVALWVLVALVLCERNRRKNPNEHGAENAIACLWPIFGPIILIIWLSDKFRER